MGKKLWREHIRLVALSMIFLIVGLGILIPSITESFGFGEREDDISELQHVRGKMLYFLILREGEQEVAFVLRLHSTYVVFLYDAGLKNFEFARNRLLSKINSQDVEIDVWTDGKMHFRSFQELSQFQNIFQLSVDGEMLISYDDYLESHRGVSVVNIGAGGAITLVGVLLGVIVYRRAGEQSLSSDTSSNANKP